MENKKQCFKCKKIKTLSDFYKHPQMPDGYVNKCKECNKKDVRENYKEKIFEKRSYDSQRSRYSFQRIFSNRWMHIKNRCDGKIKQSVRYSKYNYLTKEEFIDWCYKKENIYSFFNIWRKWKESNFQRNMTPTIDRKNDSLGYTVENIQWLSLRDNILKCQTSSN